MIEKRFKLNYQSFLFGQNINKILNKKVDICATFRTKHGLNRMHLLWFHNKLGDLFVKELVSILKVQGSTFANDKVICWPTIP
jgi:hypothetical protein